MAAKDWRALGIFGLALIAVAFLDVRFAWWLVLAFGAVVIITHAGRIADAVGLVQG